MPANVKGNGLGTAWMERSSVRSLAAKLPGAVASLGMAPPLGAAAWSASRRKLPVPRSHSRQAIHMAPTLTSGRPTRSGGPAAGNVTESGCVPPPTPAGANCKRDDPGQEPTHGSPEVARTPSGGLTLRVLPGPRLLPEDASRR